MISLLIELTMMETIAQRTADGQLQRSRLTTGGVYMETLDSMMDEAVIEDDDF